MSNQHRKQKSDHLSPDEGVNHTETGWEFNKVERK